jgi:hypothetical protein
MGFLHLDQAGRTRLATLSDGAKRSAGPWSHRYVVIIFALGARPSLYPCGRITYGQLRRAAIAAFHHTRPFSLYGAAVLSPIRRSLNLHRTRG